MVGTCELLDFRCIFVNEIAGSVLLASIMAIIFYFIIAGKMRLGFDTTITFLFPLLFMFGLAISGFSVIYAFSTVLVSLMVAWLFNRLIGNR